MIKRLFSYLIPIKVFETPSNTSSNLEVTWNNGKLVLDSKHTNYSHGSLEKVLEKGMQHIGYSTLKNVQSTLLLGVAGGSAINLLRNKIHNNGIIIGVDIDPKVIDIATTYFNLGNYQNFEIVIQDAQIFIAQNNHKFDFVILDIFEDDVMPSFLFESNFIENIKQSMANNSWILFNFMLLNDVESKLHKFTTAFQTKDYKVTTLVNVETFNKLIVVNKIS
ncbi:spermidine synthase [Flavobacterium sp.]|jgi:spermidine synthase|uniref:spermidine synthase n=1 Tax=Flavobacterium sp. TaxID=239 RepID=UPI0037BEE92D